MSEQKKERAPEIVERARKRRKEKDLKPWKTAEDTIMPETEVPKTYTEAEHLAWLRNPEKVQRRLRGNREGEYSKALKKLRRGEYDSATEAERMAGLKSGSFLEVREREERESEEYSSPIEAEHGSHLRRKANSGLEAYEEALEQWEEKEGRYDSPIEADHAAGLKQRVEDSGDPYYTVALEKWEQEDHPSATEAKHAAYLRDEAAKEKILEGRENHAKILDTWEEFLEEGKITTSKAEMKGSLSPQEIKQREELEERIKEAEKESNSNTADL